MKTLVLQSIFRVFFFRKRNYETKPTEKGDIHLRGITFVVRL